MEQNDKSTVEATISDITLTSISKEDEQVFGIAEESDYHRVARGCPKGFTQQCGTGYRT
jgi:hypothetical protein